MDLTRRAVGASLLTLAVPGQAAAPAAVPVMIGNGFSLGWPRISDSAWARASACVLPADMPLLT